jgi:hypothetical protein
MPDTGARSGSTQLAASAADEWTALVSTAVVGIDRRLPPPPDPGWAAWAGSDDPAVALLDRAAAVVVARRAGARPDPVPEATLPSAPADPRPACPAACAARLGRILGGEHDLLLAEWLDRCESAGVQLPWASLPTLLLRGRRTSELDVVVRRVAGGRAAWLADVLPELGVRSQPARRASAPVATGAGPDVWGRPPTIADSGAAVAGIVQVFVDGLATWAVAPQLRRMVSALDQRWLPTMVVELSRLPFHGATERTRADLLALAEFRHAMIDEFP